MNDQQLQTIHDATHGAQKPTWCALCDMDRMTATAADIEGENCLECGDVIATDRTPKYVFKEGRVCVCGE